MSVSLTINGVSFQYPETNDTNWGTAATQWAQAVTSGLLQKAGGTFTLTAEVYFGATYGIKTVYLKSDTANVASAGQIRLAKTDTIKWRNNANGADIALDVSSDALRWAGNVIYTTANISGAGFLQASNNLSDVASANTSRSNLGIYSAESAPGTNQTITSASKLEVTYNPSVDISATLDNSFAAGDVRTIVNRSATKVITLKANDASTICIMIPKSWVKVECVSSTPATNTSWIQRGAGGGWVTSALAFGSFGAGFGTVSNISIQVRRNEANLEGRGIFTIGTVAADVPTVGLPYSLNLSTSSLPSSAHFGIWYRVTGSDVNIFNGGSAGLLYYADSNATRMRLTYRLNNVFTAQNGDGIFSSGDKCLLDFVTPISGWEIN